eukprot:367861-Rhodomonas_salina.5
MSSHEGTLLRPELKRHLHFPQTTHCERSHCWPPRTFAPSPSTSISLDLIKLWGPRKTSERRVKLEQRSSASQVKATPVALLIVITDVDDSDGESSSEELRIRAGMNTGDVVLTVIGRTWTSPKTISEKSSAKLEPPKISIVSFAATATWKARGMGRRFGSTDVHFHVLASNFKALFSVIFTIDEDVVSFVAAMPPNIQIREPAAIIECPARPSELSECSICTQFHAISPNDSEIAQSSLLVCILPSGKRTTPP